MRWHVHGTDASTGQPIILSTEEPAPTHAVQSALSRRILVSHVVRAGLLDRKTLRNAAFPLLAAGVVVLLPLSLILYQINKVERTRTAEAVANHAAVIETLRQFREAAPMPAKLEAPRPDTLNSAIAQVTADFQSQLSATHAELTLARQQLALLQSAGTSTTSELAAARKKIDAAQSKANALSQQLTDYKSALARAESSAQSAQQKSAALEAAAARLTSENAALSKQVDLLKSQLLLLAAKPDPAPANPTTEVAAPAPKIWALPIAFDAASDFINLHFDKDSHTVAPGLSGMQTHKALNTENASIFQMKAGKDRVYLAALTLSFAHDLPKEKRAENDKLARDFLKTFAPAWKNPAPWLQASTQTLAGKTSAERLTYLDTQFEATLIPQSNGMFTLQIQSPRAAFDAD